ncbi:unnamed protein product [Euphydryas editha]|uniref:Uncharacterized protein n=1 Tax=Euphydryas editha TaxID=104508 RepID=A0AAU9VBL3_EUPED|nr:unnamed protein product [Euphydryas editha]
MLLARREKLISNYTDYENTTLKISLVDESDEDDVAGVEEKYFCMLSKIDDRLKELRKSEVTKESEGHVAIRVNSQLPTLDIPRFDSKDSTKYKPSMDIFKAVVDNYLKLSNIEKLCYLHKYLAGEALAVIINLPLINESY